MEKEFSFLDEENKMAISQDNAVSVFTTNKSLVQSGGNRCYKVTECSAFFRHATYKAFYKKILPIEITIS